MNFMDLASARFSVRHYTDRPVEEEKLAKILEAGRIVPTAANKQPQKIYVLKSKEAMEKINSVCKCIYGAPMVLVICYDVEKAWHNPFVEYHAGETDCAIVCTHMMLEAWELGIGSCWVGLFHPDQVAKALELPEGVTPTALLLLGYAAEEEKPKSMHTMFRPMEELVAEL